MGKIEAKNIIKYFEHDGKPLKAIGGVNLTVNDGEFVCIVGPSGCGKSTFLRILAGLEKPDDGEILLDGKKLVNTGPDRIMVFQEGIKLDSNHYSVPQMQMNIASLLFSPAIN